MATTKTIKASGGDYTTLAAWELAMDGDLTGTGYSEAVCYAVEDTAAVVIDGWTTTADDYIYIHTDASARHSGAWDGDKYNLVFSNGCALWNLENYVRMDGLQIQVPAIDSTVQYPIRVSGQTASANDIRISNCIIRGAKDVSIVQHCLSLGDVDIIGYVWNCILYDIGVSATTSYMLSANCATASIYGVTGVGGKYGLVCVAGTVTAKNCYFGGSNTEDYTRGGGQFNKTNCASEDQSADDDNGSTETATNCVAAAVPVSTDTFVNVTAGSEDFHLAAGSALIGVGVDTSGDAAPMNFSDDIDGDTRS